MIPLNFFFELNFFWSFIIYSIKVKASRTSVFRIENCICQNPTMFFFHNSANSLFLAIKNLISYLQRFRLPCSALYFVSGNSRCISPTVYPCNILKIWRKVALHHQKVVCSMLDKKLFLNIMFPILVSSDDLILLFTKTWNSVKLSVCYCMIKCPWTFDFLF